PKTISEGALSSPPASTVRLHRKAVREPEGLGTTGLRSTSPPSAAERSEGEGDALLWRASREYEDRLQLNDRTRIRVGSWSGVSHCRRHGTEKRSANHFGHAPIDRNRLSICRGGVVFTIARPATDQSCPTQAATSAAAYCERHYSSDEH